MCLVYIYKLPGKGLKNWLHKIKISNAQLCPINGFFNFDNSLIKYLIPIILSNKLSLRRS